MSQNGVVRFAGNLDPSAQEFRPTYPPPSQTHLHFPPFLSPPQHPPFFPDLLFSSSLPPPSFIAPAFLPPSIPPPASTPTRALLLTAVPTDVSESLLRRELEIFGDVRAVQMERVLEGIITVHFYDLRAAHAALDAVREQHMQHQNRLRVFYSSPTLAPNIVGPPLPPPAPGLIAGRPVWAQFSIPATNAFPDGQNQGTIVIFNLNPTVSALRLKDIFQNFGAVKELRETPLKRQQRFVEFYDVRDAARALAEMNNKEINGRTVMIEYSRPGGHYSNKKFNPNHHQSANFHHNNHISKHPQPQLQPPPPAPSFSLHYRRTSPKQNSRCQRSSSSEDSLEAGMRRLTLRGGGGDRKFFKNNNGGGSSNGNCSSPGSNTSSKQKSRTTMAKVKTWKGKQKNFDPRYMIKEEAIMAEEGGGNGGSCKDTRTTVMIKNIPNKYSQKLLLNMLDNHCIHCNEQIIADHIGEEDEEDEDLALSSYDFVYLPIDFNNKCNVGYGFVNMTSPEATLRLYKAFHNQHWEVFNSRKICEVTYARVQGLEALKEHFKNSKFACENDEYLPVVFSPPRDGQRLPPPLPIVFTTTTTESPTIHHHNDDIDGSDFTSFTTTTTTTTTTTSSSSTSTDKMDHTITQQDINDQINGGDGSSSTNSSSSNDGGDLIIMDDDDDGCSNRSMGCSVADYSCLI